MAWDDTYLISPPRFTGEEVRRMDRAMERLGIADKGREISRNLGSRGTLRGCSYQEYRRYLAEHDRYLRQLERDAL